MNFCLFNLPWAIFVLLVGRKRPGPALVNLKSRGTPCRDNMAVCRSQNIILSYFLHNHCNKTKTS